MALAAVAPVRYRDRLLPNTTVDDVDLSGLSSPQAREALRAHADALASRTVTLRFEDRSWESTLSELGFSVDLEGTVTAASKQGRSGGFAGWYPRTLGLDKSDIQARVLFHQDAQQLDRHLESIAQQINTDARNAFLTLEGREVILHESASGLGLDAIRTRANLVEAIDRNDFSDVALAAGHVEPRITTAALIPALEQAQTMIKGPIRLTSDTGTRNLSADILLDALVLPREPDSLPFLDAESLQPHLDEFAKEAGRLPRNARLQVNDSKVSVWEEGTSGKVLDVEATISAITVAAQEKTRDMRVAGLAFREILPEVREDTLQTLGLVALLGSGSSSFEGSPDTRRENVHVAAGHVSRTLIPPGGTWSFNRTLGPITSEEGYVSGRSIQNNWFADDIGGGVCQISTTVFRAALYGGFRFQEWHYHGFRVSFYVSFYELDGWSPGVDAAIYQPNDATETGST